MNHDVIPEQQHGFRARFSTVTQLHKITSHIRSGLDQKLSTGMISIDIEKAFDRVWHAGLIYKLIRIRLPQYLIRMIHQFLTNRTFQTTIDGKMSTTRLMKFGTAQGSVLSPTLYNIYVHDIPLLTECHVSMFADDTAFYTSSRYCNQIINRLETAVKKFQSFFKRWKIRLNEEKTQAIFITNRRTRQIPTDRKFKCGNHEIDWAPNLKYLGIIIDKKLKFKDHCQYVLEKSQKVVRILFSMINRKSELNIRNKILLYKVAIRPIHTYASPILRSAAKCHVNKLQTFQNKTLKMILNRPIHTSTQLVHEEAEICMLEEHMKQLDDNFQLKLDFLYN